MRNHLSTEQNIHLLVDSIDLAPCELCICSKDKLSMRHLSIDVRISVCSADCCRCQTCPQKDSAAGNP